MGLNHYNITINSIVLCVKLIGILIVFILNKIIIGISVLYVKHRMPMFNVISIKHGVLMFDTGINVFVLKNICGIMLFKFSLNISILFKLFSQYKV